MRVRELLSVIAESTMLHIAELDRGKISGIKMCECVSDSPILEEYMDRHIFTVAPAVNPMNSDPIMLITLMED